MPVGDPLGLQVVQKNLGIQSHNLGNTWADLSKFDEPLDLDSFQPMIHSYRVLYKSHKVGETPQRNYIDFFVHHLVLRLEMPCIGNTASFQ